MCFVTVRIAFETLRFTIYFNNYVLGFGFVVHGPSLI